MSVVPSIAAVDVDASIQLLLLLSITGMVYLLSVYLLAPIIVNSRLSAYMLQVADRLPRRVASIVRHVFGERRK
jgi:hypothetical protein